jgi:hypothetical protein
MNNISQSEFKGSPEYNRFSVLHNLVYNAEMMNIHTNKHLIEYLFYEKFIDITIPDNFLPFCCKQFIEIVDLFYAKYKDNCQLSFIRDLNEYTPIIKVLYPEIEIVNSKGKKHLIKDLFVIHSFAYRDGHLYPLRPKGCRGKTTIKEQAARYRHSHLPTMDNWIDSPFRLDNFCIGSDTEVSRMLAELEIEMELDRYELFLFCIDTMVNWESLEGVPHISLEHVENALSKRVYHVDNYVIDKLVNRIISSKIRLDVDFYVDENSYKILENKRSNDFIKKVVLDSVPYENYKKILVTRIPNTNGHYLELASPVTTTIKVRKYHKDSYTIFRGRKYYPSTITTDPKEETTIPMDDCIVYPNFLKNVLRKLELKIYRKAVTKSAIKLFNQGNNAARGTKSNTVSVQIDF